MSKLHLPDVTLVMIETRAYELGRMAIEECLRRIDFGDVLIFTDRPTEFISMRGQPVCIVSVPNWQTKIEFELFRWLDVASYLRTTHALFIEWDAWVWDTALWDDAFLGYDYIGPPWRYDNDLNVGGGGFCLVSTRLKRHLRDHPQQYPLPITSSDWLLCCEYRPRLETEGFVWAPQDVADRFAFEYFRPSPTSRHFGFHGIHNFNEVLSPGRLEERAKLMLASKYVGNRGGSDGDGGEDIARQRFILKNRDLLNKLRHEQAAVV